MKSVMFDISKVSAQHLIPRSQLYWDDKEVAIRDALDGVIVEVEKKVLVSQPVYLSYYAAAPASWWQHFKRDVLCWGTPVTWVGWWIHQKIRDSVKYETIIDREDTVHQRVCPHLPVSDYKAHVEFLLGEVGEPV